MPPNTERRRTHVEAAPSTVGTEDGPKIWREDNGVSTEVPLFPSSRKFAEASLPTFTMAEVSKHNKRDDCWIVLDDRVYDITSFVDRHPGGVGPIVNMAGKDATDVFANYHAARVYKNMLPQYLVGEVTDCPVYPHVADFREARQQMLREGLFETDMMYYYKLGSWLAFLFGSALALSLDFVGGGTFGAHMLGAAILGIFWQQLAGVGHDLGHSGVTHDFHTDHKLGSFLSSLMGTSKKKINLLAQNALENTDGVGAPTPIKGGSDPVAPHQCPLGKLAMLPSLYTDVRSILMVLLAFKGLSVCWWKSDHNTHHVVCNAVEHDPNIQHMPMIAVTDKIFQKPFYDTYHKKTVAMDAIARFLVSYQHILFYPLMALGRWNLYAQGFIFLLSGADKAHYKYTELTALTAFFGWFFSLVCTMPTLAEGIAYIFMSHAVAGLLHVQIVLSHWSMETYKGTPYTSKETEWHLMQLRTTMNVATPEWLDYMHIGLQFQIEHHLYPRLPRHNLRKARELVKPICKKHGIHYHEPGFFAGNIEMWKQLKKVALQARKTNKADGGFYQSTLWEGLNLSG